MTDSREKAGNDWKRVVNNRLLQSKRRRIRRQQAL